MNAMTAQVRMKSCPCCPDTGIVAISHLMVLLVGNNLDQASVRLTDKHMKLPAETWHPCHLLEQPAGGLHGAASLLL